MSRAHAEDQARHWFENGYVVFERAYGDADVEDFRAGITALHAELGTPPCFSTSPCSVAPFVEVSQTGLVIAKLLSRRPDFAERILKPAILDVLRRVLGDGMYLEITAGMIADDTRPFFRWHTHLGGQDDTEYRQSGKWPCIERPRRASALLYLEDMTEQNGPLLVYPRPIAGPTGPPCDLKAEAWADQVVVRVPRGSVVLLDECTWHAVRPKTAPGLRVVFGCNYASASAPLAPLVEDSLRDLAAGDLLRSVLPPPSGASLDASYARAPAPREPPADRSNSVLQPQAAPRLGARDERGASMGKDGRTPSDLDSVLRHVR